MKEQYQKEISQIHVPKELLEKTKQAMKEEEQALSREKKAGKKEEKALSVKEVERMPEEFQDAEETVIGDITMLVAADGETGYLKAYFEKEEKAYTVTSKLTDLGEFEEALKEELK